MAEQNRIAVVSGANRGIGLEVCKQLAQRGIHTVLTSRDQSKGQAAYEPLKAKGLPISYHPLDVTDPKSIGRLKDFVVNEFNRCDILVNNAGIFPDTKDASDEYWPSVLESGIETVREAMETNVYGAMLLCQAFVPLMKKHNYGRIINLSSGMGRLTDMNGHCPAYRISKTAINALTRIVSEELLEYNILVNSVCPGWVKTDMGGPGATREPSEGADTIVWLATAPDNGPRGKFLRDRNVTPW